jgi:hypothetical protein
MLSNAEGRDDLAPDEVLNIRSTIVDMERTQSRLEFQYRTALITFSEAIGRDLGALSSKGAPPARSKPKDAVEKPELRDELIRTLSHE